MTSDTNNHESIKQSIILLFIIISHSCINYRYTLLFVVICLASCQFEYFHSLQALLSYSLTYLAYDLFRLHLSLTWFTALQSNVKLFQYLMITISTSLCTKY